MSIYPFKIKKYKHRHKFSGLSVPRLGLFSKCMANQTRKHLISLSYLYSSPPIFNGFFGLH